MNPRKVRFSFLFPALPSHLNCSSSPPLVKKFKNRAENIGSGLPFFFFFSFPFFPSAPGSVGGSPPALIAVLILAAFGLAAYCSFFFLPFFSFPFFLFFFHYCLWATCPAAIVGVTNGGWDQDTSNSILFPAPRNRPPPGRSRGLQHTTGSALFPPLFLLFPLPPQTIRRNNFPWPGSSQQTYSWSHYKDGAFFFPFFFLRLVSAEFVSAAFSEAWMALNFCFISSHAATSSPLFFLLFGGPVRIKKCDQGLPFFPFFLCALRRLTVLKRFTENRGA